MLPYVPLLKLVCSGVYFGNQIIEAIRYVNTISPHPAFDIRIIKFWL